MLSSELIMLKTFMKHIVVLKSKLGMFGVIIEEETKVLCANNSVVNDSSLLESTPHNKHSSLDFHAIISSVAADMLKV